MESGLNWTVGKEQLTTSSGIEIPNKIALIREDTKKVLAVHNATYEVFQNEELLNLLEKVSQQTGLTLHKGGFFGEGQKVFIQLKSNDLVLGNDKIEGFITGINSFDGTTSLAFGHSNITISCQNTFFAAFRGLETKVKHTKKMMVRIEDVLKRIDNSLLEEKLIFDKIVRLSETRYDNATKESVIKSLFDIEKGIDFHNEELISNQTKTKIDVFYNDYNGEIAQKGDNLWGLFSAVTKYTTHSLVSKADNSEEKMFGTYGRREREIFSNLIEMV